jgi:hypothetical protein
VKFHLVSGYSSWIPGITIVIEDVSRTVLNDRAPAKLVEKLVRDFSNRPHFQLNDAEAKQVLYVDLEHSKRQCFNFF